MINKGGGFPFCGKLPPFFCVCIKEKHHTSYEVQCFLVEITGPTLITVTLLQSMHGAPLGELSPHSFGNNKKAPHNV